MIPFMNFHTEFRRLEYELRGAMDQVWDAGWFILGRQLEAFEREFAGYAGVKHAVGVASGTDALHLALAALDIGPGCGVIAPANTCVPTVTGIALSGAQIQLADIDPATRTLSPESVERAIGPETKAIVPVHLYGHPCDMDALRAIAARHGLVIVEDAAQAHGAEYRGRRCGALGEAAAFSFYPTKNLGAYGDAGAVTTNDDETAARLRRLRNYGEEQRYHHSCRGVNSRLDEMQAAMLRVKLRHLDAANQARRDRAGVYDELLAGTPLELPSEAAWATHNYHLYVVRTPRRDALAEYLRKHGVGTLMHYPVPVHRQEAFQDLGYAEGSFPESERACGEVLSLPLYPDLPLEDVCRVAETVKLFFSESGEDAG